MRNNSDKNKSIEQLRKRLYILARMPPSYDPFSRVGAQAFTEWGESCRAIESELRNLGEDF